MGEAVREKIAKIHLHHYRMKQKKHGWLVRPATLLIGWVVVVFGLVTIPLPGPGWFTVFVGVGILSLELAWPNRLLGWGIRQYDRFEQWWGRQARSVRWLLVAALLVLIWVVFALVAWAMWQWGMLDWAKPTLQPWVDKVLG